MTKGSDLGALSFVVILFSILILFTIFGLPEEYQIINTFDFLWLGGGVITITAACVVISGVPCAILEASYGVATLLTYIGLGTLLNPSMSLGFALLKAFVLTPIALVLIFIIAKLARGSSS